MQTNTACLWLRLVSICSSEKLVSRCMRCASELKPVLVSVSLSVIFRWHLPENKHTYNNKLISVTTESANNVLICTYFSRFLTSFCCYLFFTWHIVPSLPRWLQIICLSYRVSELLVVQCWCSVVSSDLMHILPGLEMKWRIRHPLYCLSSLSVHCCDDRIVNGIVKNLINQINQL